MVVSSQDCLSQSLAGGHKKRDMERKKPTPLCPLPLCGITLPCYWKVTPLESSGSQGESVGLQPGYLALGLFHLSGSCLSNMRRRSQTEERVRWMSLSSHHKPGRDLCISLARLSNVCKIQAIHHLKIV